MITEKDAAELVASVPHWHHKFEVAPGIMTPGSYNPDFLWKKLGLPDSLIGKRTLDIGSSDGFFAREMHKRGADVVCIDYRKKTDSGFAVMEQIYGHTFDYRHMNVFEMSKADLGQFDIVLFLGVLYHLPDMIRALNIVRSLTGDMMYLESHCENEFCRDTAAARYYRERTLVGDWTNFWAPNKLCLLDMLLDTGFKVQHDESWGDRILVKSSINNEAGLYQRKMRVAYGVI